MDNDLAKFQNALEKSGELFWPLAAKAAAQSLQVVQSLLEPYPAQPPRNRAKTFNTYVRGVGRLPKSSFTGGGIKTKGAKVRRVSERMSTRFKIDVKQQEAGVTGELKNTASYSGWVLGPKDTSETPHQAPWHKQTGWANIDDTLNEAMPQIEQFFGNAVDEFISKLVS